MARRSATCSSPAFAAVAGAITCTWVAGASAQATGTGTGTLERPLLTPGLRAAATYTDNVLLAPDGLEDDDLVFEVSPYIEAEGSSRRAQYRLSYQMRNFWRADGGESALFRHALNAAGTFSLIEDRVGVDATAYMGAISNAVDGAIAFDPGASFANTSKIRQFSVSPWTRSRIADFASYQLRYTLAHTGGESSFALADTDQRVSASVDGLGDRSTPWNWRWYGEAQRRDYDTGIALDRRASGVALYYRLSPALRAFGTVDYEQIDEVRNEEGDDSGYGPGLGFDWAPNSRTSASASVSRRYYGTIGNARAAYSTERSTFGVQYFRRVETSADSALLFFNPQALTSATPGVVNPVLDNLGGGIIRSTSGALTQGLVTDTALLERRLTAFYGLYNPRNSVTFSVFASTRESPSGNAASGGIGGVFVGELRERGAAILYRRRLDPRASIDVGVEHRRNDSSTANFDTRATILRLGYLTQLTSSTAVFTGVRHTRQRASDGGLEYDENAVFAGFDMRFR